MMGAEAGHHLCQVYDYLVRAVFQAKTGLGTPDESYRASWDWLPLVPGLGPLSKSYKVH